MILGIETIFGVKDKNIIKNVREENQVKGKIVDGFIKYVKEQFDYNIILNSCKETDSFASVFCADFLGRENVIKNAGGCFLVDNL